MGFFGFGVSLDSRAFVFKFSVFLKTSLVLFFGAR